MASRGHSHLLDVDGGGTAQKDLLRLLEALVRGHDDSEHSSGGQRMDRMRWVQTQLAQAGATELLIKLLRTASSPEAYLHAVAFGIALLDGGNAAVQVRDEAARLSVRAYCVLSIATACRTRCWPVCRRQGRR
jgi:hypothetical protein